VGNGNMRSYGSLKLDSDFYAVNGSTQLNFGVYNSGETIELSFKRALQGQGLLCLRFLITKYVSQSEFRISII
jgi:hypothetical protein